MIKAFLLACFAFHLQTVFAAQTVVISDIDDTLKDAYILSSVGKLTRAYKYNAFGGTPELLERLVNQNAETRLFYVSNAYQFIMGVSHSHFLEVNRFPAGDLRLRSAGDRSATFKINTITNIITLEQPQTVILIGDNGERDAHFYREITARFAGIGIRFLTFIRHAYSPVEAGAEISLEQIPFMAVGEVAAHLHEAGLMGFNDTQFLLEHSYRASGEGMGFPEWVDCRALKAELPTIQGLEVQLETLTQTLRARCSQAPALIEAAGA